MKKDNAPNEDTFQPEYDFSKLKVSSMGKERKSFGGQIVRLDPDVAEMFPNAEAVNEALRFLVRVTKNQPLSASK